MTMWIKDNLLLSYSSICNLENHSGFILKTWSALYSSTRLSVFYKHRFLVKNIHILFSRNLNYINGTIVWNVKCKCIRTDSQLMAKKIAIMKLPFRLDETEIIITIVKIAFYVTHMSLIFWKTQTNSVFTMNKCFKNCYFWVRVFGYLVLEN